MPLHAFSIFYKSLLFRKKININLSPLGLVLGVTNIGFDYAVARKFTLGGSFTYISLDSGAIEASATGLEIKGQYFFTEAFTNSWYLLGMYAYTSGEATNNLTLDEANLDVTSLGALGGYMWMWTNFNIQLGLGVQSLSVEQTTSSNVDTSDFDGSFAYLDFRLGWAF